MFLMPCHALKDPRLIDDSRYLFNVLRCFSVWRLRPCSAHRLVTTMTIRWPQERVDEPWLPRIATAHPTHPKIGALSICIGALQLGLSKHEMSISRDRPVCTASNRPACYSKQVEVELGVEEEEKEGEAKYGTLPKSKYPVPMQTCGPANQQKKLLHLYPAGSPAFSYCMLSRFPHPAHLVLFGMLWLPLLPATASS